MITVLHKHNCCKMFMTLSNIPQLVSVSGAIVFVCEIMLGNNFLYELVPSEDGRSPRWN